MRLAFMAATRASCDRKKVGAVIVSPDRRIVSTGYNGSPSGVDDCDTIGHTLVQTGLDAEGAPKMSCVATIHAEANAIAYAGRVAQGCAIFTTVSSCFDCAKLIIQAGITTCIYAEYYASRYGKSDTVDAYLRSAGLKVVQFDSPGLSVFRTKLAEVERIELEMLKNTQVEFQCGCTQTGDIAPLRCRDHKAPRVHD